MARKKTVKSGTTDLAQPQNRTEEFLAKIAGLVDTLPQGEFSRLERYLKYIAENGGGGGGGVTSFNTRTGDVTPQKADYSEFFAPANYGGAGEALTEVLAASASESDETYGGRIDVVIATAENGTLTRVRGRPPEFVSEGGSYIIDIFKLDANTASVHFFNGTSRPYEGWLCKERGTWKSFQWVNPPLMVGQEYRTTGRYLGQTVYEKVVNFDTLPNATTKTVAHGITSLSTVLECTPVEKSLTSGSPYLVRSGITEIYCDSTNVVITSSTNLSGYSTYVKLKYIKTTG